MKFQPKRFIVEVKRGTNRAAFASPDPATGKFSDAEATLFGRAAKVDPERKQPAMARSGPIGGRILRSLVEPPPPPMPELPEPPRRGRKPGSKNRPKPEIPSSDIGAERPRRGRKPGSKNRPKAPAEVAAQGAPHSPTDMAAIMRGYGFADDGPAWDGGAAAAGTVLPAADPAPEPRRGEEAQRLRPRLRDRSTILRRYVLALEPGPGQFGSLKAKRLARSAR